MKQFFTWGSWVLPSLALVACGSEDTMLAEPETAVLAVAQVAAPSATAGPGKAEPAPIEVVAPMGTPELVRERPYRSYPAATGYPGFRVYYQKRCYPGCHFYPSTPAPTQVHP
jgi:hypothetical protein